MVLSAFDVLVCLRPGAPGTALFPYTTLFRSEDRVVLAHRGGDGGVVVGAGDGDVDVMGCGAVEGCDDEVVVDDLSGGERVDRKRTRLNSSHVSSSYAVFGLIKKGKGGGRLVMLCVPVYFFHDGDGGGRGLHSFPTRRSSDLEDRVVLAHRGGDGGVVVGAGDGDVDVMGCGAVEGCDDEVVVDDLSGGEREIGRAHV